MCILLDSCGLAGTLTLTPGLVGAQGALFTLAPVSRARSDLVGVLSGRGGRGLQAVGMLFASSPGTLVAAIGGPVTCSSRGPLAPGGLSLGPLGARLAVGYSLGGAATSRTRCPGPELPTDVVHASIPRRALAARSFTVTLPAGPAFTDDGYVVSPHGQVILTLRPGGFTEHVLTAATG